MFVCESVLCISLLLLCEMSCDSLFSSSCHDHFQCYKYHLFLFCIISMYVCTCILFSLLCYINYCFIRSFLRGLSSTVTYESLKLLVLFAVFYIVAPLSF